jgi:glutamine amidotransferase
MKIVIVDYGMGNLKSISSALTYLGVDYVYVSAGYEELENADKVILPGVGSFGKAMKEIRDRKIDVYLQELVIEKRKPLLGICLGMQLLGLSSTEDGFNTGLGFIEGTVTKFDNTKMKVPHVGFNQVRTDQNLRLYKSIVKNADFYFTHSYRMLSDNNINQSVCNYNGDFIAGFEVDNIAGVQFHPELSQTNGIKLLKNFIDNF